MPLDTVGRERTSGAGTVRRGRKMRLLVRCFRLGLVSALLYASGWAVGSGILRQPSPPVDTPAVREAKELLAFLDDLEARLHQSAGWVNHHAELAVRHQTVSAIACVNAEDHTRNMSRIAERQRQKRIRVRAAAARTKEESGLHGRKLAAAETKKSATSDSDGEGGDD